MSTCRWCGLGPRNCKCPKSEALNGEVVVMSERRPTEEIDLEIGSAMAKHFAAQFNYHIDRKIESGSVDFKGIAKPFLDAERAEVERLEAELADWRETQRSVMAEKCPTDERHCTCVPMLRKEIESLRALERSLGQALNEGDGSYRP